MSHDADHCPNAAIDGEPYQIIQARARQRSAQAHEKYDYASHDIAAGTLPTGCQNAARAIHSVCMSQFWETDMWVEARQAAWALISDDVDEPWGAPPCTRVWSVESAIWRYGRARNAQGTAKDNR